MMPEDEVTLDQCICLDCGYQGTRNSACPDCGGTNFVGVNDLPGDEPDYDDDEEEGTGSGSGYKRTTAKLKDDDLGEDDLDLIESLDYGFSIDDENMAVV